MTARIGHNQGPPLDPDRSWRAHCWTRARRELVPRLPLEVIRRRVVRARELGLAYPDYAAILLGSGRDVTAFLFTSEAIGLRLQRGHVPSRATIEKLDALTRCDRLLFAEANPEAMAAALAAQGLRFAAAAEAPEPEATPKLGGAAIRRLLGSRKLPGDAVVMIGARTAEAGWAEAARLARWLPAERYFRAA